MIVRLHGLSARTPLLADLGVVASLMGSCDALETGSMNVSAQWEEISETWHTTDFSLQHDAWVIATKKGEIVGYADVRFQEDGHFGMRIRVHPEYRGRGIGTLLAWLIDERARHMMRCVEPGVRVALRTVVHSSNQIGRHLYDREGYTQVRSFWRLIVEMDEMQATLPVPAGQSGKLKLDLVIDGQGQIGATRLQEQAARYSAHQYLVYEKELRPGSVVTVEAQQVEDCVLCS